MTRPDPSGSPCFYRYRSGDVRIDVTVGVSSGSFNHEIGLSAGCSAMQTTLHLSWLGFSVEAWYPQEFWSSFINNMCPAHPSFINNAAGRTYTRQQTKVFCPATIQLLQGGWPSFCGWAPLFPLYSLSFRLDGAPGGRDTPACSSINLTQINHSWSFDVVYTDTSGPFPVEGRIPRAVTLNVSE